MTKRRYASLGQVAVLLAVVLGVLEGVLAARTHTVTRGEGQAVALGGMVIAVVLWLGSFVALVLALQDARRADFPDERAIARRDLQASLFRIASKTCLMVVMVIIWAARFHAVLLFLRRYPYSPYILVVIGLQTLAINEFLEAPWRRRFRDEFSRPVVKEEP